MLIPAFYETPEISARFSQAITALLEASTPPYVVVTQVYGSSVSVPQLPHDVHDQIHVLGPVPPVDRRGPERDVPVVLRHAELSAEVHAVACVDGGWLHLGDRFASWEQCWASLAPPPFAGVTAASMVSMLRRRHPDWSDGAIQATMANLRVGPDGTVEPRLAREHHARILRSLWEDRPRDRYERIGVPVLLAPAGDPAGPTGLLVDEAARLLPRATVRWYAGADHDVHAQYPAEVAADLLALA